MKQKQKAEERKRGKARGIEEPTREGEKDQSEKHACLKERNHEMHAGAPITLEQGHERHGKGTESLVEGFERAFAADGIPEQDGKKVDHLVVPKTPPRKAY